MASGFCVQMTDVKF